MPYSIALSLRRFYCGSHRSVATKQICRKFKVAKSRLRIFFGSDLQILLLGLENCLLFIFNLRSYLDLDFCNSLHLVPMWHLIRFQHWSIPTTLLLLFPLIINRPGWPRQTPHRPHPSGCTSRGIANPLLHYPHRHHHRHQHQQHCTMIDIIHSWWQSVFNCLFPLFVLTLRISLTR